MTNHVWLMTVTAVTLTLSIAEHSLAQSYDFTVELTSGPLTDTRYLGQTQVEPAQLTGVGAETLQSLSITFDFGGVLLTEANDVRDRDAKSPSANFQDGVFIGNTYLVLRFGQNSTDLPPINNVLIDGFAIDNNEFGYIVGANLYQGEVTYELSNSPKPVPEPSLWLGLAALAAGGALKYG